ncbi:hypothetical protein [Telmatospirillum sp.]|uniref:hypothetical protein n=1 Tax=Telmatospirillum sp. TaxID=2079197 RepID=UPI002847BDE0|nr:hypothetical protein [Telmatospirillum sp.]MDR3440618.1 hypothetical protein [Telmatospirillum sp.]
MSDHHPIVRLLRFGRGQFGFGHAERTFDLDGMRPRRDQRGFKGFDIVGQVGFIHR